MRIKSISSGVKYTPTTLYGDFAKKRGYTKRLLFNATQIRSIRARHLNGEHPTELAAEFRVSVDSIRRIVKKQTYKDVT